MLLAVAALSCALSRGTASAAAPPASLARAPPHEMRLVPSSHALSRLSTEVLTFARPTDRHCTMLRPPRTRAARVAMASRPARSERQGLLDSELLQYLWPRQGALGAKLRIVIALLLLLVAKMYVVRVPFIFKAALDSLASPTASRLDAAGFMVLYGLSRAIYTLLQEGRYLVFSPVGQNALRRFVRDAFDHVQTLDSGWLSTQSTGQLSRVFARGVRGMNALLRLLVFNVVPTGIEAILVVSLLGRRYGLAYLAASMVAIGSFVAWSLAVVELRVKLLIQLNTYDNMIFTRFFNALTNNEAVRSFTNEKHEVRQYDGLLGTIEDLSVRDVKTISLLNAGQALIFSSGLAIMMAISARRVLAGQLTIGDVVAINGILLQLQQPLTSLAYTYQEIRQSLTDLKQMLQLLRHQPSVVSNESAPDIVIADGRVVFSDVSFSYGSILRNVSFEIPARSRTAIVGTSGSGKSTILKLILRLYDPDSGTVSIDGQDIQRVSITSLRQQLGLVPQDTILFDESMLYNLRYGNMSATDDDAIRVAKQVGLDETAAKMPDGYNTRVGERGMTISGGERQRVAIARALLKDPPLMLYDEPTSALDSVTESSVQEVIDAASANRTSIVVAHKLSLIQDADYIMVMKNGTLVETGTHDTLLCLNGTYHNLWAKQSRDVGQMSGPLYCDLIDRLAPSERRLEDPRSVVESGWLW
ncbi:hypothetical protein AB1Y20_011641 [Prymnesium parvum]|uniref:ATP-dependent transporter ycf16 n=1 Tax=Prymnesium parvum TaxID=97485 RepID=A0AB34IKD3_PRYPA